MTNHTGGDETGNHRERYVRVMSDGERRRRERPLVPLDRAAVEPAPVRRNGNAPPVVLVVDDEPKTREQLRISLSLEGWTVEEAANAEEAIEQWRLAPPDVVLLDQRLKGTSGLECAARLRGLSSDARIILFSAHLDAWATKEARRLRLLPMDKTEQKRLFELLAVLAEQIKQSTHRVS